MTHFADRHHRPATTAILVTLFWLIAAAAVSAAHATIDRRSVTASAAMTIAALLVTAFAYAHFCARECGVTHALGVGIAWLALSIAVEVAIAHRVHHGWFSLLGSPAQPLLRNVYLFAWIFAPALFARRENESR